jgi:hypothetical protein
VIHNLLAAALKAAPPDEVPMPPYHGGAGGKLAVANAGYLAIALEAVDAVGPYAKTNRFRDWRELAREIYARHDMAQLPATTVGAHGSTGKTLDRAALASLQARIKYQGGYAVDTSRPAFEIVANAAALVGYWTEVGSPADAHARLAVRTTVEIVAAKRGAVRHYLEGLDRAIVREAMRTVVVAAKLPATRAIVSCLWRGVEGKRTVAWIGELEGGALAVAWTTGGRLHYLEGDRRDVFACVPDELMDAAAAALK